MCQRARDPSLLRRAASTVSWPMKGRNVFDSMVTGVAAFTPRLRHPHAHRPPVRGGRPQCTRNGRRLVHRHVRHRLDLLSHLNPAVCVSRLFYRRFG